MKRALITGITGQDGSYLADLLLAKGYEVHGLVRRGGSASVERHAASARPPAAVRLHEGDMTDAASLVRAVAEARPDEVYNLAAQSHVGASFRLAQYTADIGAVGTTRLLDAVREAGGTARFYQASSSEIFGKSPSAPRDETSPFHPRSPYAVAKLYGFWITVNFREAWGMHCSNGILFNHESPRRDESYVTRKITRAVGRIVHGLQEELLLGSLDARRDWGFAGDYVEGIWRIVQAEASDDFVLATGESHSVREFTTAAFARAGVALRFEGKGIEERGLDTATGRVRVRVDPAQFRPSDVDDLVGDASKARRRLGWEPTVRFRDLVAMMTDADVALARTEAESAGQSGPPTS